MLLIVYSWWRRNMYMNVVELSKDGSCFSSSILWSNKMYCKNLGKVFESLKLFDNVLLIYKYSLYNFSWSAFFHSWFGCIVCSSEVNWRRLKYSIFQHKPEAGEISLCFRYFVLLKKSAKTVIIFVSTFFFELLLFDIFKCGPILL